LEVGTQEAEEKFKWRSLKEIFENIAKIFSKLLPSPVLVYRK
jgi:hypothetical protein